MVVTLMNPIEFICYIEVDRLCGLVVRVPGYRSRGAGSIQATAFRSLGYANRGLFVVKFCNSKRKAVVNNKKGFFT
jgi:hypothetical protein